MDNNLLLIFISISTFLMKNLVLPMYFIEYEKKKTIKVIKFNKSC